MKPEKRIFAPRQDLLDGIHEACVPWIGQVVTVVSWAPIDCKDTKEMFPGDTREGLVKEFGMSVPESELGYLN